LLDGKELVLASSSLDLTEIFVESAVELLEQAPPAPPVVTSLIYYLILVVEPGSSALF